MTTKVSGTSAHEFPLSVLYCHWYKIVPSAVNEAVNEAFPPAIRVSLTGIVLAAAADPKSIKSISPLSSKYAQKRLRLTNQIDSINFKSLVIIQDDEIFEEGAAVKLVIRNLTGILYIFRALLIFPDPAINTLYRLFAKNRTKMFGRHSSCPVNILDNEKFLYE